MRERGLSTLPAILLAAAAGLLAATFMADWMVVDAQTTGEDAVHLKLPFPLVVARAATACVPREAMRELQVPAEVRQRKEQILAGLQALAEVPDATLVKVETPEEKVLVAKEGKLLRISVDAPDAIVRCTVPLDGALEALRDWDWQTFDPGMVFDLLSAAPRGDLVRVEADDGTRVAISMW
jgi:hypothetical protein